MKPDLIIMGQATIDHVVPAKPGPWRDQLGGNALYGAAGARLWIDAARIGLVTRIGRGFPDGLDDLLSRAGIANRSLAGVPDEHLVEWIFYEVDGSRRSLPRNRDLRDCSGEGGAPSIGYLRRLRALSPSIDDVPKPWLPTRAVHLAPQVEERHRAALAALRDQVSFLSVDPSPHYSRRMTAAELGRMFGAVDAFLPSEQEVGHLARGAEGNGGIAQRLRRAGLREIVLKQGVNGALLCLGADRTIHIEALRTPVRDPTGAGDAFCGAYAACRMDGIEPSESARRATVAAAMIVGCCGVVEALALSPTDAQKRLGEAMEATS